MKLSRKAEYALRALVAMGRTTFGKTFSIHDLAEQERIPLKFLEQILLTLKNGGILRSKRGVGGGYQLQIHAEDISLQQVIDLIDGPFTPIPCCDASSRPNLACECGKTGGCALGQTLLELQTQVHAWLRETTVAHIIAREESQNTLDFEI